MADKESQVKGEETTVEEVDKAKKEEIVPEKEKAVEANGDAENGSDEKDGEDEKEEKNGHDQTDKVCTIKRKSTGGDAKEDTPAEGATPEKKAKIDEPPAEAESNGDAAEVAA
ncbi:hypothetical protein HHI36_016544 [Cryptolaemus montrouzieri]|uniref:Uncharacterized protein n=1 Tax=Cryptolaemus montrouzieri TaxID=559131 RepID=A0ABD2NKG9_9CUCU